MYRCLIRAVCDGGLQTWWKHQPHHSFIHWAGAAWIINMLRLPAPGQARWYWSDRWNQSPQDCRWECGQEEKVGVMWRPGGNCSSLSYAYHSADVWDGCAVMSRGMDCIVLLVFCADRHVLLFHCCWSGLTFRHWWMTKCEKIYICQQKCTIYIMLAVLLACFWCIGLCWQCNKQDCFMVILAFYRSFE